MAKLLHKKRLESENMGADDKSALVVSEETPKPKINKYVFSYSAAPSKGVCETALLDLHGEIPLRFVDGLVEIDIPEDHHTQSLLRQRFLDQGFVLVHSPNQQHLINSTILAEATKRKEVDYWVFQHSDRAVLGDSYSGTVAILVSPMESVTMECVNGIIKTHDPVHAKGLKDAGFFEVAIQYK